MARYFIRFAYRGTNYHGWQKQPNGISVQETLDKALSMIAREEIKTTGAGRTDAGVHAKEMYAHLDTQEWTPDDNSVYRVNKILPRDICVYDIKRVEDTANARFDAKSRTYEYWISTQKNPFLTGLAMFDYTKMDYGKMNEAAETLMEYEDFTSFSKTHTDTKTNNCRITEAKWEEREKGLWVFTITANRFLRNMVRAIVGTLMEVGRGKMTTEGFRNVIEAKDRCKAGTSAEAEGLYLTHIEY